MAATPDRIRTQRHVTAMVALDTVDLLAERIRNLLAAGRHMTTVRRYTYVDEPPEVTAGLTVDGGPRTWTQDGGAGFKVPLQPGLTAGFGFAAYVSDGSSTEAEAWRRYHAALPIADEWSKRRRDMTWVEITGGLPGDGPARDDHLVIRHWNRDGVCEEVVVAFDCGTGATVECDDLDEVEALVDRKATDRPLSEVRVSDMTDEEIRRMVADSYDRTDGREVM